MKLLIVESPAKAKTISKYLDDKYKVVASIGHIRDLPKSNKSAIDIEAGFVPRYEISSGKEKVVSEISKLAKKSDEILLATDPDREGEAIAWHVAQACGIKNPKRVVFYEITKSAVQKAVMEPRLIDQDLRKAQEARRVLDRLVGYNLSGLIWKKLRYGLSAGRVQSPALRILAERERLIRAFVPEDFFVLTASVKTDQDTSFSLTCSEEPKTLERSDEIIALAHKEDWHVVDIKESEIKRAPRPPFTTSTLQQTASSRLGFSPSNTMRIAQKLYEAGLITYMRTDSTTISKEAQANTLAKIEKGYGKDYIAPRHFQTKSKNAQEAHEAIRPTDAFLERGGTTDEQKKLYRLIWQRTTASQMTDARLLRTKITANTQSNSLPNFFINGSRLLFAGWLTIDPDARAEDIELPQVAINEALTLIAIDSEGKQTEPPRRYSEAGLIKELEKRGIGRPSTYASIIKTLADREYTVKENKALCATETGEIVSEFLEKHFANIVSDSFTAEMEQELDDISNGKRDYAETLRNFYTPFTEQIRSKEKMEKINTLEDAPSDIICPKCGKPMVVKLGRTGKFYSCATFPECSGARTMEGNELQGPRETGEECPKCKSKLVEREGKFGKFISCSNYPKCKYIKKEEGAALPTTGIKCPVCKDGEMAERHGRFGIFYSCSNYPKCKHAIKTKPTGNICHFIREDKDNQGCGALMMLGTKTIPERCSDKTCPNHHPHKLK
ncbi:MAG: type I DNA topoisomerase [Candidatus Moranbacteria bacterium]|nr:type I DNA topoisomerase [Candidatus Moranbacteria bacterium]